ncbi:Mobile element protein [Sphingobium indicum BiD32]|uniref:Mobile element protein n=1 Tax=Sphingobium indicum BiD32 TaxID=1301087 RepID=N1MIN8_9SPHN|nr:Mobile element protein [Sphingobium indicum BiD32]
MVQIHPQARTTPAVRADIARSTEPASVVAKRYGISVYVGPDESITALTDHGVDELTDMLSQARLTTKTWHQFLDDFVDDPELAARFKTQASR